MTILQYFFSVYVSALGTILGTPQVEPDPALIAQLEQERPAPVGKNGADALFALPKVPTVPAFQCQTDSTDCLAKARQSLATYHKEAKQHQKAWQKQEKAIAVLLQYGHFRYLANLDAPPYGRMISERFRATYRFVDGEKEAAMQSVCTDAVLGLHFINTAHSQILDGIIGASMIGRDVPLLAEMLAESPAGTRLPAACDEVKVQPAENLSLCPRMYGEWRGMSERLQNALQEEELKKNDEKLYKESGINPKTHIIAAGFRQQTLAYALHKVARACTAEAKAAVARGELPDLNTSIEAKAQYCSPYNGICIAIEGLDYTHYQARLLNVNRYLTALGYLRHPTDTLPAGYHIENNTLTFTRYPSREDEEGMQTVTLPLPGGRQNSTTTAQ
jgi:hypothetical protein